MNRKSTVIAVIVLYLFTGFGATAQIRSALPQDLTIEDHLFILDLKEASAPIILENRREIIFSYLPTVQRSLIRNEGYQNQLNLRDNPPMQVYISFAHEQFRTLYPMDRSPEGVYFYYFSYNRDFLEKNRTLDYRFVVNGVWMDDPHNPYSRNTFSGTRISQVYLPEPSIVPDSAPIILDRVEGLQGRAVRFIYEGPSGKDIYVAGSFNAWDPYLHRLQERPSVPGVYELTMYLPPGNHHYHFFASGQRALDPLNGMFGTSREGVVYSRLMVPQ